MQVEPYWVQFHAHDEETGDSRTYHFLVTAVDEQDPGEDDLEQVSGEVLARDRDNPAARAAGLVEKWTTKDSIGRGGPGQNVSWSPREG